MLCRPPDESTRRTTRFRAVLATFLSLVALLVISTSVSRAEGAVMDGYSPVVVSLTFDDGNADQYEARDILAAHGMRATFYLNSGRLDRSGYLSMAQAKSLVADGHEIGGHTVSHADLPTLDLDEQRRQVCQDRNALLSKGFDIRNFAYPYGDTNADTKRVVAECGYNSARGVGDIVSPGTCSGCPYAETVPPRDFLETDTPDSVRQSTSLETLEGYVQQAEANGGGWVQIVLHRVCSGCDIYSIAPDTLDQFLGWLAGRADQGVSVRTVAEVVGGTLKDPVTPPPAPAALAKDNLLRNPSLEDINTVNGTANCWQRGGYGTNSYVWALSNDAHTGVYAQQIDISAFSTGDRKLISRQDLGSCAPRVLPGHRYDVGGWYRSDSSVRLVAYYRTEAGGWVFWAQSGILPASSTWAQGRWTTPLVPTEATAVSVGLSLRSTGYMKVDDFALSDHDTTGPSVAMRSPLDGSLLRGIVPLTAEATDPSGIDHVEFLVDGVVVGSTSQAPYVYEWDTTTSEDMVVAVAARAVDTAGNVTLSESFQYSIGNSVPPDTEAPRVVLTAPLQDETVNQVVTITADVTDNDRVNLVAFYVNGTEVGLRGEEPYSISWDSSMVPDGQAQITAQAFDRSGNAGSATPITITVDNNSLDSTPPVSAVTCDGATCSDGWYRSVVQVRLVATDDESGVDSIFYTLDGTDPTPGNGMVYSEAITVDHPLLIKFRAVDGGENLEDVQALQLQVDTTAPTGVSITAPTDGSDVTGYVYIKVQATDDVGIARVRFYVDGRYLGSRITAPWQWRWNTANETKGTHTVTAVVSDPAGNVTSAAPVTVKVF
jgi:peptidoglycan/xylan/chitin deacetylase (PgdA/CDA1 family)